MGASPHTNTTEPTLSSRPPSNLELDVLPAPVSTTAAAAVTVSSPSPTLPTPPTATSPPNDTTHSSLKTKTSLIALFLTTFLTALNTTIIATATPTICRELNSASGYAWIGAAYFLGTAAAGPVWAKLSDIWGRKLIMLTALVAYAAASVLCALARSMAALIAGRVLQGVAGGGLGLMVAVVVADLFSVRRRSFYIGMLELVWAVAGGIGPILGGTLAQHASWRYMFWLVLPVCALSFVMLYFTLEVHNPRTGMIEGFKAIDWAGSLSILAVLLMVLLGMTFGGVIFPWNSPTVICLIVIGTAMSGFFIFSEKKLAKYPLIPLRLFANRMNVATLLIIFIHHFGLYAGDLWLPFFFQSAGAFSPVRSGVLLLPLMLTESLTGFASGLFINWTGRYLELIWIGLTLMTLGQGLYIYLDASTSISVICTFQIISGIGFGMLLTPPVIALQANTRQSDIASTLATVGLMRNISTVLAAVLGQVLFQNGMAQRQTSLSDIGLPKNTTDLLIPDKAAANLDFISGLEDSSQRLSIQKAYAGSLRNFWILSACLAGLGLALSTFLKKKVLSNEHVETKTGLNQNQDAEGETLA